MNAQIARDACRNIEIKNNTTEESAGIPTMNINEQPHTCHSHKPQPSMNN